MRKLLTILSCAIVGILLVVAATLFLRPDAPTFGGFFRGSKQGNRSDSSRSKRDGSKDRAGPDAGLSDSAQFEDGGIGIAILFTGPIHDVDSLAELPQAIKMRGDLGLAVLRSELEQLHLDSQSTDDELRRGIKLQEGVGKLYLYKGQLDKATAAFKAARELCVAAHLDERKLSDLTALLGIAALRRGEADNCLGCLGPSSCILPISPEATHKLQSGSREAIDHFQEFLAKRPDDLRVRWLLNLAYMTLGEYPDKVPRRYLLSIDYFRSEARMKRFPNVAVEAGLTGLGPNLAGGSVFDDFTGDGLPDLFITSLDAELGASFFVNKGDGTFEDRSAAAGLGAQVYALNVTRADFDNDGRLDVLLLRGAWEKPLRLSLLRNKGDGTFEDVTLAAGLGGPMSTESAAWGDFDNDGFVDVFICGEFVAPFGDPSRDHTDARNRCRLYHNQGDGTFVDVAARAGVTNDRCAKGSAWCDYDEDGDLDLFVSNMGQPSRLYRSEGDGTFLDVAPALGVTGGVGSFACWFWDYDNDGRPDLFLNDNFYLLAQEVSVALGLPLNEPSHPRLYRNLGPEGFRDVSREVGLDRAVTPMGCNFGDIDNDGYLDFYLGTGAMSYEHLVPNRLFKNDAGRRFLDVTTSTGTGHLQKGHGVSFADYDNDGHLDFFVEVGGAVPGDTGYNLLFQNPGLGRHWLKVKLIGTKTNRSALGARIKAVVNNADGSTRAIYRTIGHNSSFGGNSLVEHIGLADASAVAELEITWPTSRTVQRFQNLGADQSIEITELAESFKVVRSARPEDQRP